MYNNNGRYSRPRKSSRRNNAGFLAAAAAVTITERGQRLQGSSETQNLQRLQESLDLQGLSSATTTSAQTLALEFLTATGVQVSQNMGESFSFQDEPSTYNTEELENPNIIDPDIANSSGQEVTLENDFSDSNDPIYELDDTISEQQAIAQNVENSSGNANLSAIQQTAVSGAGCMVSMASAGSKTGTLKFLVINGAPE
jgi:hypothetical protein